MIRKHLLDLRGENGFKRSLAKVEFKLKQHQYYKNESLGNGGSSDFAQVTYCVAPNAGDTVLSRCVRDTIASACKVSGWQIIPVKNPVTTETIKRINKCEKLIIGGGGLFLPDTNKNPVSGWQWAISPEDLVKLTSQICVFSVGYNYFHGQEPSELFTRSVRSLVERSAFFGLRNKGSIEAVKALIPAEMREKIVFQPCTTTLIRRLYNESLAPKKDTGCIAVNMAFDREERRFGEAREIILNQVADAVSRIQEKGYRVYYVCHCSDDDKFLPYLKAKKVRYQLVDLSRQFPDNVLEFYNRMDVVIGMRGHAQMIPFGLNCEILSLGTHDKMKWFLEDIDALDWYVDLTERPDQLSDEILNRFVDVHEKNREATRRRLLEAQDMLWNITCNNLEIIRGGGTGIE